MGIKGNISKSNLSRANERRDWRIFAQLAHHLINEALALYAKDELIYKELNNALYALDSTTIDLCLKLISKEGRESKIKKKDDIAKTPFQRLFESNNIDNEKKLELLRIFNKLNPFELQEKIKEKIGSTLKLSIK